MTDILTSTTQFAIWLCMYLAFRFAWSLAARIIVFIPLAGLMVGRLLGLLSLDVPSSYGRPLDVTLTLASLAAICLFLFEAGRKRPA